MNFPKMTNIPSGKFLMRCNETTEEIHIDSFSMSVYPITVREYESYCFDTSVKQGMKMPHGPRFDRHWCNLDCPMVNVSWEDAKEYCIWLSQVRNQQYDLPTEAQWEYAARGGLEDKEYPWGDHWNGSLCANSVPMCRLRGTAPVGSYPSNDYGLYDMVGNVSEWCRDLYDKGYFTHTEEHKGTESDHDRVVRGGSWNDNNPHNFGIAFRLHGTPECKFDYLGFRIVTLPRKKQMQTE